MAGSTKEVAQPKVNTKEPVSLGLFGGCTDHEKLNDFFGQTMKILPEQDHRDWEKIGAWGRETLEKLLEQI